MISERLTWEIRNIIECQRKSCVHSCSKAEKKLSEILKRFRICLADIRNAFSDWSWRFAVSIISRSAKKSEKSIQKWFICSSYPSANFNMKHKLHWLIIYLQTIMHFDNFAPIPNKNALSTLWSFWDARPFLFVSKPLGRLAALKYILIYNKQFFWHVTLSAIVIFFVLEQDMYIVRYTDF